MSEYLNLINVEKKNIYHHNPVDKSALHGIIKVTGSDSMDLENQRYERNKDTLVNKTYIESGEYRRKFDRITDNSEVNKTLYDCAKKALKHRSGTILEDMYWIDSDNGDIFLSSTDNIVDRKIDYTDNIKSKIKVKNNLITIHTHPNSMPPSIYDLNSNCKNNYKLGVIACHDGKVFIYSSDEIIEERIYSMYIESFNRLEMSDYEAQIKTLEKLSKSANIKFKEVNQYE